VGGPDLARLEDGPGALIARPVPVELVAKAAVGKRLGEHVNVLLAELVAPRGLLWPCVAVGQLGIEIRLGTAVLITLDPRLPLQLPVQQIDFLEVATGLTVLQDQLHQSRLQGAADALHVVGTVPPVAALPGVECFFLLAEEVGDISNAPTHPVQKLGLASVVALSWSGNCGIHAADADARARYLHSAPPV